MIFRIKNESGKTLGKLPKTNTDSPLSNSPKVSRSEMRSELCAVA